jgi:hypothetical protein
VSGPIERHRVLWAAVKRTCFYHAGCPDGFGAAWAVWKAWGESARYVAIGHDDVLAAPDCADQLIAFVDIAPNNRLLGELAEVASQVVVLDHHVSALKRFESEPRLADELREEGHRIHFDLSHSGAVLAWQYFGGEEPTPDLLRYVEDQDLWAWKLDESRQVNAAIGSYPRRFDVWSELDARQKHELAREGEPIVRANKAEVERVLHTATSITIGRRRVEAVNSTHSRSSVGHELAKRARHGDPWGCVYRITGDRVHVSIYSIGDFDVSTIAGEHGGGGHRNASGFSVALKIWLQDFV